MRQLTWPPGSMPTSRLGYCNALYTGLLSKAIWKLPLVQNAAAWLLVGAGWSRHISPILQTRHWLPISDEAQFKVLPITHKAFLWPWPLLSVGLHLPLSMTTSLKSAGASACANLSMGKNQQSVTHAFLYCGSQLMSWPA